MLCSTPSMLMCSTVPRSQILHIPLTRSPHAGLPIQTDHNYFACGSWLVTHLLRFVDEGMATGSDQSPPLRFLCLHGGGSSETVMRIQVATLSEKLGEIATFEYLQGPQPWTDEVDPTLQARFGDGPFFGWYGATHDSDPSRKFADVVTDIAQHSTDSMAQRSAAQCSAVHHTTPHHTTIQYSALQHSTAQHSTAQHTAPHRTAPNRSHRTAPH